MPRRPLETQFLHAPTLLKGDKVKPGQLLPQGQVELAVFLNPTSNNTQVQYTSPRSSPFYPEAKSKASFSSDCRPGFNLCNSPFDNNA